MALASKLDGNKFRVYAMIGDGESQEGQIWEAAMAAPKYKLDNLCVILDHNKGQIDGFVDEVMSLNPIADKWQAFNWHVVTCDGHDYTPIAGGVRRGARDQGQADVHPRGDHQRQRASRSWKARLAGTASRRRRPSWRTPCASCARRSQRSSTSGEVADGRAGQERARATAVASRDSFGDALVRLGETHPELVVLEADLSESTRSKKFAKKFPDRFFQMGIAEANMLGVAAGLSLAGKVPFCCSFACFVTARFDQIRMSVCYSATNVRIVGSHAGVGIGEDGYSQMGLEDIALMRSLPTMTVIQPADDLETAGAVEALITHKGPAFLRTTRQKLDRVNEEGYKFEFGKGVTLVDGKDLTIVASGGTVGRAVKAAELLAKDGVSARVINIHTIKPIDVRAAGQGGARDEAHPDRRGPPDHRRPGRRGVRGAGGSRAGAHPPPRHPRRVRRIGHARGAVQALQARRRRHRRSRPRVPEVGLPAIHAPPGALRPASVEARTSN